MNDVRMHYVKSIQKSIVLHGLLRDLSYFLGLAICLMLNIYFRGAVGVFISVASLIGFWIYHAYQLKTIASLEKLDIVARTNNSSPLFNKNIKMAPYNLKWIWRYLFNVESLCKFSYALFLIAVSYVLMIYLATLT